MNGQSIWLNKFVWEIQNSNEQHKRWSMSWIVMGAEMKILMQLFFCLKIVILNRQHQVWVMFRFRHTHSPHYSCSISRCGSGRRWYLNSLIPRPVRSGEKVPASSDWQHGCISCEMQPSSPGPWVLPHSSYLQRAVLPFQSGRLLRDGWWSVSKTT